MTDLPPWRPGGGVPLTRRMVVRDAARFAITIGGVGMTVVLMLFLLALYDGVRTEANGWVASRPIDAWVAQMNTTNFIKASSFLPTAVGDTLQAETGVLEVSPLLRVITLLDVGAQRVTAIVIGLEPGSALGRPDVVKGSPSVRGGGIVLDWALSRRMKVGIDDTLVIQGHTFRVTGLSRGTNSVLTQFAFVTYDDARTLLGLTNVASYFLVRAAPGMQKDTLIARLRARLPKAAVLSQATFAENNMDEMRGGLLPILSTVAVLGSIVAVAVLTLLLYGSVLERREDYALLKAIGAPSRVLGRVMLGQALAAVCGGMMVGGMVYAIAVPMAEALAPAVPLSLSARNAMLVAAGALVTGAFGALLPLGRIARIHPAEVFRA
ncbi:MAG: ABC transporter permease [Gemmatimonadaceae bacterium]|nr:ABC transporter permease [Gemmatimonadaceae bacterium]